MPSLGTPHAASKAQAQPATGVMAYVRANYKASDTQTVQLSKGAGTTPNQPSVAHVSFPAEVSMVPAAGNGSLTAVTSRMSANTVSKTSTALKSLNGKLNTKTQQNVTLSDAAAFGFTSIMQNDTTVEKIPEPVLKLLKKLVRALKTKPEDVTILSGAVTSAVGSFSPLKNATSYSAYDATTGKAGTVFVR
jgi:hypothetical protein